MTEIYLQSDLETKQKQKRVLKVKKLLRNLNMKMTIDVLELNDGQDSNDKNEAMEIQTAPLSFS